MSERILESQLAAWDRKPALRRLYGRWFAMVRDALAPGPVLEVGAGIGKFKEVVPGALSLDILPTRWTDMAGDAQCLPVRDASLGDIVLFDVLHHLPRPVRFLEEAERALMPGGRVVIMDPYVSPLSYPVYRFLHPEGVDRGCDPLGPGDVCSGKPFDSDQGVATALFWRDAGRLAQRFPRLVMVRRERLALLAYPLSGGFGGRSLAPDGLVAAVDRLERYLGFLAPLLAFRTFVVLEKHDF